MTNEHNPNEQNRPQDYNNTGFTAFSPANEFPGSAPVKVKHSGPGIASFVLALIAVLTVVIGIIMSVAAVASSADFMSATPEEIESQLLEGGGEGVAAIVGAGLLMILSIGFAIIGLILGIVGVVMKNRKKVFGVIGLILNALIVLSVILLVAVGMFAA
jgi:hypothetical protein